MSEREIQVYEIVHKLIGPIRPAGDASVDDKRLANLKRLALVVDKILFDINDLVSCADSHEHSVKIVGEYARKFMNSLEETFGK